MRTKTNIKAGRDCGDPPPPYCQDAVEQTCTLEGGTPKWTCTKAA